MPPLETDCVVGGLPVPALGTHQLLGPLDRAVGGQVALQEHALRAVGAALGPGEEQVRRLDEAGHRAVDWGGGDTARQLGGNRATLCRVSHTMIYRPQEGEGKGVISALPKPGNQPILA